MADEYIKKKDIEQKVTAITGEWKDGPEFWIPIEAVLGNIDLLPAEDVAPVRHGRWVEYGENKDGTHNIHCPVCDAGFKSKGHANSYYTKHKYRYCPNCGAKMDEE